MKQVIGEGELRHNLIKELCSGRKFVEAQQSTRERSAAAEAYARRDAKTSALGKCLLVMPANEYFNLNTKYDGKCWQDRGFIKDMQRLEPQFAVNKL